MAENIFAKEELLSPRCLVRLLCADNLNALPQLTSEVRGGRNYSIWFKVKSVVEIPFNTF